MNRGLFGEANRPAPGDTSPGTNAFVMRPRKGPFVRPFDKAPRGKICPQVYVLAHANGCPYSCDYCYLQLTFRYLDAPTVFSNRHDLLREVRQFLALDRPMMLHAGKLSDSLVFDPETALTEDLVPLFDSQNKHKLLLLTKSTNVAQLLDLPKHRHTVVGFSVNAPALAERFESNAPSPSERLQAARSCQEAGYEVRIRIDPVIPVDGWQELYKPLVDLIHERVDFRGLRVTIGNLRYFRPLSRYARARGADATVFDSATWFDPDDGRMRVPPEIRLGTYRWFREQLDSGIHVCPCKESSQVWRELGLDPTRPKCTCAL